MLNSVARYLWGSSSDADQDIPAETTANDHQTSNISDGDQTGPLDHQENIDNVTTRHCDDDDWVLVGVSKKGGDAFSSLDGASSTQHTSSLESDDVTTSASLSGDRETNNRRNVVTRFVNRGGHIVQLGESATPQQLARMERTAQNIQRCVIQKVISTRRCERHNKSRDLASHPKVKTNNRRNKRMHASGAKSSRFSQRM